MTYFRTVPDGKSVGVVVVGAGGMGRRWIRLAQDSDLVDLVGVVDIEERNARTAVAEVGADAFVTSDVLEALSRGEVGALINVTVPEAHFAVNEAAVRAGVPVLCEKPLVPSLVEAYRLAGLAESSHTLLMASQSRRYYRRLAELRRELSMTGPPFLVTAEFFRDPHFGGFRETMAHPLLVDMAIHAFDTSRYLTGTEPVSVQCESFNPSWSWYDGDAAAIATFEMSDGARFVYTGSWCSGGLVTSWNGSWRLSGPHGSVSWDGVGRPVAEPAEGTPGTWAGVTAVDESWPEEIDGALHEFVAALRSGERPSGDVHSNIWTLGMVHAATTSADQGGARVYVGDLLESAYNAAIQRQDDAAQALRTWTGSFPA